MSLLLNWTFFFLIIHIITSSQIWKYQEDFPFFLEVEENITQRKIPHPRIDLSWINPQPWAFTNAGGMGNLKIG